MISPPFRRIKHFIREKKLPGEPEAGYSATLSSQKSSNVGQGASLCGNKARFAALVDSAWGEAALES